MDSTYYCCCWSCCSLPGNDSGLTALPVIGVPVALKQLDRADSLYSIEQMPI
ncbi:hypothetical protein HDU76_009098, partial [Blyttiomyces sp. JEL0837]